MRLLRWSGYLFIVLLAATAVVMGMGSRLPAEHTATATGEIAAPRERVWSMIVDVAKQPGWRTGLKAVEVLSAEGDETCWREVQAWMAMPLCATRSEAPRLRVVQIADPKLPFGGSWTYELEAAGPTSTTRDDHGAGNDRAGDVAVFRALRDG